MISKAEWLADRFGHASGEPAALLDSRDGPAAVGNALHRLHELPIEACPFSARLEVEVPRAWSAVLAGLVDERRFNALLPYVPPTEELVVTHGQPTAGNVVVDASGAVTGLLEPELLGVADRHRDLGVAARSIEEVWGTEAVAALFVAYGRDVDRARLEFYRALDELW